MATSTYQKSPLGDKRKIADIVPCSKLGKSPGGLHIKGSNKQFTIKVLPLFRPPHLNPLPLKGERVRVRGSAKRKMYPNMRSQ